MTTILEDIAAQKHHAAQDELVGQYLIKNGEADRDFLYNVGLEPVGRILNPRGRIHELRAKGWQIETIEAGNKCTYKLIAAPAEGGMNQIDKAKKPKIMVMGEHGMEEVDYDSIPDPDPVAYQLAHYFAPVKISPKALNLASKIIPQEYCIKHGGLHALLEKRANEIFAKLSASQTQGMYGKVKYFFEFDAEGPVLKTVSL